jgi:hypothetical protein
MKKFVVLVAMSLFVLTGSGFASQGTNHQEARIERNGTRVQRRHHRHHRRHHRRVRRHLVIKH